MDRTQTIEDILKETGQLNKDVRDNTSVDPSSDPRVRYGKLTYDQTLKFIKNQCESWYMNDDEELACLTHIERLSDSEYWQLLKTLLSESYNGETYIEELYEGIDSIVNVNSFLGQHKIRCIKKTIDPNITIDKTNLDNFFIDLLDHPNCKNDQIYNSLDNDVKEIFDKNDNIIVLDPTKGYKPSWAYFNDDGKLIVTYRYLTGYRTEKLDYLTEIQYPIYSNFKFEMDIDSYIVVKLTDDEKNVNLSVLTAFDLIYRHDEYMDEWLWMGVTVASFVVGGYSFIIAKGVLKAIAGLALGWEVINEMLNEKTRRKLLKSDPEWSALFNIIDIVNLAIMVYDVANIFRALRKFADARKYVDIDSSKMTPDEINLKDRVEYQVNNVIASIEDTQHEIDKLVNNSSLKIFARNSDRPKPIKNNGISDISQKLIRETKHAVLMSGIPPKIFEGLATEILKFSKSIHSKVIVNIRPTSIYSYVWNKLGALPKPEWIKSKTFNEIDHFLMKPKDYNNINGIKSFDLDLPDGDKIPNRHGLVTLYEPDNKGECIKRYQEHLSNKGLDKDDIDNKIVILKEKHDGISQQWKTFSELKKTEDKKHYFIFDDPNSTNSYKVGLTDDGILYDWATNKPYRGDYDLFSYERKTIFGWFKIKEIHFDFLTKYEWINPKYLKNRLAHKFKTEVMNVEVGGVKYFEHYDAFSWVEPNKKMKRFYDVNGTYNTEKFETAMKAYTDYKKGLIEQHSLYKNKKGIVYDNINAEPLIQIETHANGISAKRVIYDNRKHVEFLKENANKFKTEVTQDMINPLMLRHIGMIFSDDESSGITQDKNLFNKQLDSILNRYQYE